MTDSDRVSPFGDAVKQFQPKPRKSRRPTAEEIDQTSTFPARETVSAPAAAAPMTAIGIRYKPHVIERFKKMCKDDRRSYGDMLEILMDRFEEDDAT